MGHNDRIERGGQAGGNGHAGNKRNGSRVDKAGRELKKGVRRSWGTKVGDGRYTWPAGRQNDGMAHIKLCMSSNVKWWCSGRGGCLCAQAHGRVRLIHCAARLWCQSSNLRDLQDPRHAGVLVPSHTCLCAPRSAPCSVPRLHVE